MDEENNGKHCLICGKHSEPYLFCPSCFSEYENRTLLFKIQVNYQQQPILVNDLADHIYVCKDGHIVKSKSERDIDNYLFDHKIRHVYEKTLITKNNVEIKPDFYLPDLNVYIEHWGYDTSYPEYIKVKEKKLNAYKNAKITVICTNEENDAINIESALDKKLKTYIKGKINFI